MMFFFPTKMFLRIERLSPSSLRILEAIYMPATESHDELRTVSIIGKLR